MDLEATHSIEQHRSITALLWLERAATLLIWLTFGMNFLFPWENFVNPIGDSGTPVVQGFGISHIIALFVYAVIAVLVLSRPLGILRSMARAWPLTLLTIWLFVGMAWAPDPSDTMVRAARFASVYIFACYFVDRYSPIQFIQLVTRGFAFTVVVSLLIMVVAPGLGHSNLDGGYESAWRGGFIHKNWLGASMSVGMFASGYAFGIRCNSRLLSGFTFLGCLCLLIMSKSATAQMSTAVTLLILPLGAALQSRRLPILRGLAVIALTVGTAALILSPVIFSNLDVSHLPELIGRSSTLTGRTGIWHAVLEAIRAQPILGYGYAFWDQVSTARDNIWLEINWQAPHAHNTWLDALLQLGMVGLVLTALIWLLPLYRSVRMIASRQQNGGLFYFALIFSSLIRSCVETVMFMPALLALFWLVTCFVYTKRLTKDGVSQIQDTSPNELPLGFPVYPSAREQRA